MVRKMDAIIIIADLFLLKKSVTEFFILEILKGHQKRNKITRVMDE